MKRLLSLIIITSLIGLIAFTCLRVKNEEVAQELADFAHLNTRWISRNKVQHTGSGSTLSGSVASGSTTTGTIATVMLPDCKGEQGMPFEWYSPEELKKSGKDAAVILTYGKNSAEAVYCWKQDGNSDAVIVEKLQ